MKQIDLDDLPPRIAEILAGLTDEEELVVARGALVVARLRAAATRAPVDQASPDSMKEVMEQFNAMIHDEF
jgi:hypothetical protein